MKSTVVLFILTALAVSIISCKEKALPPNAAIQGDWKAIAWEVQGVPAAIEGDEVIFTFALPDAYTATFGEQKETGIYRVEQDKLYTTAINQMEKMVGLRHPHPDTLILDMNRQGTQEALILVKRK